MSMNANAYKQTYNNAQVMTAPPGELTLMLYNGAIKFLKLAINAMKAKQIEETNKNIQRAQDVISELMCTLNMDVEISKNLMALYDFMNRHLLQANIKKDPALVTEVLDLVEDLRNTWVEVIKVNRSQSAQVANGLA
ncbi:flagellar export chaperone FliS [Tumebacillus permanentifrigoris]|uniref:Flagellar secretion chaperone FliS n=1 Tax=Tumebacillus permanentifrigoris TaxID=378543 RepID=A0A316DG07_9BACL|nr:flagellar export chaperone FliS [Tumebacillus permanentifrigoris]PWK16169.1 flagellar protein FliS [Tumebacillus permanentifrigoris]